MAPMCRRSSQFVESRQTVGFTLIEILVALVVVSVGVTILIQLFSSSLALAQSSRNQAVAASLAEEQMQALLRNPGAYEWGLETAAPDKLVKVSVRGKPADAYPVDPPSVLPVERTASAREENLYSRFSWKAFAKLPAADAPYVEVTVTIQWTEAGRDRLFALTSNISRPAIAAAVTAARAEGST